MTIPHLSPLRSGLVKGAAAALLLVLSPAFAQVQAPQGLLGTWSASWQTDRKAYEATMIVTSSGGTWQTFTKDGNNSCAGKEVPMKIEAATDTDLQLLLQFSEVLAGCQNVTVNLRLAPDGTVSGTRSKFELKLSKK